MITKSTREYFDSKFNKLEQIQDFTTIQTTLLAIVFSLFIFSITAIFVNFNPTLTVISYLMIFVEFSLLYTILISIFSKDWESKLNSLSIAIWLIVLIFTLLFVTYLYTQINFWLFKTYEVNNISYVIVTLLTFIISILLDRKFLDRKYRDRFKILFIEGEKKSGNHDLFEFLDIYLKKFLRK
ncbi:unnamed protein product, partial [marine sediment metagenome]